jgi:GT2 family glycosyltransferase
LLENGDFSEDDKKSLKGWAIETGQSTSAGIDLADEWQLTGGHTAFLLAAEDAPRPNFTIEQKIPVIADAEYKFSGYFATQRAEGLITLFYYDENHRVIGEEKIYIANQAEYSGGTSLDNYALVESVFTPISGTKYLQFKIELGEQIDLTQANAYLFFTNLFLGIYVDEIESQFAKNYSAEAYRLNYFTLKNQNRSLGRVKLPKFLKQKQLLMTTSSGISYQFPIDFKNDVITQTVLNNPKVGAFAIDSAFAINNDGILLYGWSYFLPNKVKSIFLHSPDNVIDIEPLLFRTSRLDLLAFRDNQVFPNITEFSGFICYVPIQLNTRSDYYIELEFNNGKSEYLKVSLTKNDKSEITLIKTILNQVANPDRIRPKLYDLFDQHLGKAINVIGANRVSQHHIIEQRQFGLFPDKPIISVIVPLYGRYDFMRHQLAHFVDDSDFDNADLIYVVDDPSILVATLETATAYHALFEKPFRVIWYDQNLGFSGANNVGVSVAKAEILLLLNSDVIPQKSGWLSTLSTALNELPKAGVVAPLLLFADNSVQHAGMAPKNDPFFPKFLLNVHPGKGMPWLKNDEPSRHPLLTAACLMVRKSDYLKVGGLDEGYIIGDFEDSDFCLKLRKMGLDLWLVPEAKLWHLERQSQNLEKISGHRQLITLYNGWRYHQKIVNGEIANPEMSEV